MDANTLARVKNEYAIMLQYADVLAQRIHLARKEK